MLTKGRITVLSPRRRRMDSSDLDPSNAWFLWPTRVNPSSGISIGSARFCDHRCKVSQCFLMGRTTPKIVNSLWGSGPRLMHVSLGPPKSDPKRHFDWFCRFRRADERDQHRPTHTHTHTHRQVDHATTSVAIGCCRWPSVGHRIMRTLIS